MANIIIILVLLSGLAGFGLYFYRQAKKAGQNEIKLQAERKANEGLKDENEDLASRPRTTRDRTNRLQKWRDNLRKNKD